MSELIESRASLTPSRHASPVAVADAPGRTGIFVALSVVAHLLLSLAMPQEARTLAPVAEQEVGESFFDILPVEPAPEPVAEPEPPPVEEPLPPVRQRVVRAIPSSAPPSVEPAATPVAAEVVADAEPAVQQASVVSTAGGLAVSVSAGAGSGGALVGTRHEGPIGQPVTREERRADLAALLRAYRSLVSRELRPHLRQPRMLGREAEARTVKLGILIDGSGRVLSVRLRESCGTEHLDELALDSVRAVAAVSAPPDGLPWQSPRELTFPVVYR
jgi:periplasmic protein TonB